MVVQRDLLGEDMNIGIIGMGYVGLVTGALFADSGNNVLCVDNNREIIQSLREGKIHFFEPGLEEIVQRTSNSGNLSFSDDLDGAIVRSKVVFLAVNTPSNGDGSFNLDYIVNAAKNVGRALREAKDVRVIAVKSTVPQGTYLTLSNIINDSFGENRSFQWAYVSNPETLAEGSAVRDFSHPDRVIIGTYSDEAFELMRDLYHPFVRRRDIIFRGTPADAELAKLFSNVALASRIAMVNEFARIADNTKGADMDTIRKMICEDSRIGYQFMFPSPGYGGSCFPKDIQGLVHQARDDGFDPLLLGQVHASNEAHKNYMGARVMQLFCEKRNPKIAVWGVTFKPGTDDMRDAASIPIVTRFINKGASVFVYDPQDKKAREIFGNRVSFAKEQYECVADADALVLLTEWRRFDSPDYVKLKSLMRGNYLFDLRNSWIPDSANKAGFHYYGVGRNYPL